MFHFCLRQKGAGTPSIINPGNPPALKNSQPYKTNAAYLNGERQPLIFSSAKSQPSEATNSLVLKRKYEICAIL